MATVVLDLHGSRVRAGIDLDAFENFIEHFRTALREHYRSGRGAIPRSGGRPPAAEAAATAFRLVAFESGSGIAHLEPTLIGDIAASDLALDAGEALSITTLRGLLRAIDSGEKLAEPVVEALGSAQRAIGDDGSFGVSVTAPRQRLRVVIDEHQVQRLQWRRDDSEDATITVTGRMHMIEAEQPFRRVGIRAQNGIDWTCSYPDDLHALVTKLIERLVRIEGVGRRLTGQTGRLAIHRLQSIPEHTQDALFTVETVPVERLMRQQAIERPQGLDALVDAEWPDDDESRLFLEATLDDTLSE